MRIGNSNNINKIAADRKQDYIRNYSKHLV